MNLIIDHNSSKNVELSGKGLLARHLKILDKIKLPTAGSDIEVSYSNLVRKGNYGGKN